MTAAPTLARWVPCASADVYSYSSCFQCRDCAFACLRVCERLRKRERAVRGRGERGGGGVCLRICVCVCIRGSDHRMVERTLHTPDLECWFVQPAFSKNDKKVKCWMDGFRNCLICLCLWDEEKRQQTFLDVDVGRQFSFFSRPSPTQGQLWLSRSRIVFVVDKSSFILTLQSFPLSIDRFIS